MTRITAFYYSKSNFLYISSTTKTQSRGDSLCSKLATYLLLILGMMLDSVRPSYHKNPHNQLIICGYQV